MRTITYTYDESKPTNKDYIVACLTDSIDDGGASYESMVKYNIDCPYFRDVDCLNEHENNEYASRKYYDACVRCKLSWLAREYDTFPADDGVWEVTE